MTRRSFLTNLGLACAALVIPVAAKVAHEEKWRGNFRFEVDPNPPRYNLVNGRFVRVEPEVFGVANPAYVDAPWVLDTRITNPFIFDL